jgi:L-histidine Nalpha-methyltransferase
VREQLKGVEMLIRGGVADRVKSFAEDVRDGLGRAGQKMLPSKYLYDEVGSALFEVITKLPEYGLTRAEERILRQHSGVIAERLATHSLVIELGSGNGRKTRLILEALSQQHPTIYCPIEISLTALENCASGLKDLPQVSVLSFDAEYLDGLSQALARRRSGEGALVLFLGSSIGNFDRAAAEDFMRGIRNALDPGDTLLLGTDLDKPVSQLIPAYDDPLGVTAAFNRNLLARINRELDGDFDLNRFEHLALHNARERRIEMHLCSMERQSVRIEGDEFEFQRDETIWTESCHKYGPDEVRDMAERCGFECAAQWVDEEWPFSDYFLVAA